MSVQDIEGDPPLRRRLIFPDAYRLATMPRGKTAEFTQAAFWSAVATATSAGSGISDLLAKTSQTKILDTAEIAIFFVCAAITVLGVTQGGEQTAQEFLHELYKIPAKPDSGWRRWIKARL